MRWAPHGSAVCALAALFGCASPTAVLDVPYDARFGDETTLDLYLPDDGAPRRPAVLFFHGGLWTSGDKSGYTLAAERLAGSGYVTATVNYRLAPESPYPAALQDARCALAFLRGRADDYGLDPDRIAVVGYAAGGHLASMLGVAEGVAAIAPDCAAGTTGRAAAVIAHAGVHDLRLKAGTSEVEDFLGGTIDEVPERYDLASPVWHVGPGAPPYLLVHGDFDFRVSREQSEAMQAALEKSGNPVRSLLLFDAGHGLTAGADVGGLYYGAAQDRPEYWIALIDFLYQTVGAP